jgi:putative oxidoreductase
MDFAVAWQPRALSLLRITTGLLLLEHGTTKFLNFPVGPMNNATIASMSGAAGVLELVGGLLLAIGLFTRPVALLLSGMTAVAYFYAHAAKGFFPVLNGGELAIVYCFLLLYVSFAGSGAWSVDTWLGSGEESHGRDWRHVHAGAGSHRSHR